jgi:hypothetical protein
MIRIDEQSLELVYLNRYKLRKKELNQLVEKLVRLKLFPLEEENKRLKENIHSMLFTDSVIQKRYEKASEENSILREQLDVKNGMINALIIENEKLKELLKECRFMLREMSDVNNWLESDECVLNYDMATECGKYATKIDEVLK